MSDYNKAIELIKQFEGYSDTAYRCPAGIWTIGYGSTSIDGHKVVEGQTITQQQALNDLNKRLDELDRQINQAVKVPLTNNQLNALLDFCYNLGIGNFRSSTLLKKLNIGDYSGASNQLLTWNKSAGKALAGLTRRRKAEKQLFDTP